MDDLPRSARRVRDALLALELPADIHRLTDSTRTAPEVSVAIESPFSGTKASR